MVDFEPTRRDVQAQYSLLILYTILPSSSSWEYEGGAVGRAQFGVTPPCALKFGILGRQWGHDDSSIPAVSTLFSDETYLEYFRLLQDRQMREFVSATLPKGHLQVPASH